MREPAYVGLRRIDEELGPSNTEKRSFEKAKRKIVGLEDLLLTLIWRRD